MEFEFNWKNKEANFGLPAEKEIDGGTHFTIEIILRHRDKFIAVRRPKGYTGHQLPPKAENHPKGCLYFCHDLPRWGETLEKAVNRIVKNQIGVSVKDIRVVDFDMSTYPDKLHEGNKQWALLLFVYAEISKIPKTSKNVTEVVVFDKNSVPYDFGWWEKNEVKDFLNEND